MKKACVCISILIIMFLSLTSCTNGIVSSHETIVSSISNKETSISLANSSSETVSGTAIADIKTYRVYEQTNRNDTDNEFDQTMANNPINAKMEQDLLTQGISGTRESQIFFDGYVSIWKNELVFSVNNLKKYLSDEDVTKLTTAQRLWEESLEANKTFDREFIQNEGVVLGTQFVSSALLYLIDQYQVRVFHLKYMTYLVEGLENSTIPEADRTWNKFAVTQ